MDFSFPKYMSELEQCIIMRLVWGYDYFKSNSKKVPLHLSLSKTV